jgi:hypothetical protein
VLATPGHVNTLAPVANAASDDADPDLNTGTAAPSRRVIAGVVALYAAKAVGVLTAFYYFSEPLAKVTNQYMFSDHPDQPVAEADKSKGRWVAERAIQCVIPVAADLACNVLSRCASALFSSRRHASAPEMRHVSINGANAAAGKEALLPHGGDVAAHAAARMGGRK